MMIMMNRSKEPLQPEHPRFNLHPENSKIDSTTFRKIQKSIMHLENSKIDSSCLKQAP